MTEHMDKTRVTPALKRNTTPSAGSLHEPSHRFLVRHEKQVEHRIGQWLEILLTFSP